MFKLAICSMFKDSMVWHGRKINHVHRFFEQISKQDFNGHIDIYALEGDSSDNTYEILQQYNCTLLKRDIGTSRVASDGNPLKYVELSRLGNELLHLTRDKYSHLLWIESDLIVENPGLITALYNRVNDAIIGVAPLVWIQNRRFRKSDQYPRARQQLRTLPTVFYDGWGFIAGDGSKFDWLNPTNFPHKGLINMCSVGSCVMFNNNFLSKHKLDFGYNGCLKGLNESIINHNGCITLDCDLYIKHPGDYCIEGRWI